MLAQKIAFQQTIVASSSFKKSSDNLPAWFEPWSSSTCQPLSFSDSSIWSSWQESAQECRSLVCPPTRAPTLSTLDQLDKWKEEGETRTRWGTSLQFSSNLPTPILLEGTEKPSHKTKSPSYEPIHLTRTCGLLLRAFILKDIDLWIKLCLLWLEGPQHTCGDSWYLRGRYSDMVIKYTDMARIKPTPNEARCPMSRWKMRRKERMRAQRGRMMYKR